MAKISIVWPVERPTWGARSQSATPAIETIPRRRIR